MIRLNPIAAPKWIDLVPGVSVLVEPIGTMVLKQAGHSKDLRIARDLYPMDGTDATDTALVQDMRFLHLVKAVAKIAITDWKGVEDDSGKPAPVTHAYIGALMDVNQIYNAFVPLVTNALTLVAEKNG